MEVTKISPFTKEYLRFVSIATKTFPMHFPLIILASLRKRADIIICKIYGRTIGGFIITDLPLNTFIFRPKIFFSTLKTNAFKKLMSERYRYLTYVVIDKKYRRNGYGLKMMREARVKYDIKSYFTPFMDELQNFYEKSGATVYKTKDGKTLDGLCGPVMVFEGRSNSMIHP